MDNQTLMFNVDSTYGVLVVCAKPYIQSSLSLLRTEYISRLCCSYLLLFLYARRNTRANQELAAGTVQMWSWNSFDTSHRSIRSTEYGVLHSYATPDQLICDIALFVCLFVFIFLLFFGRSSQFFVDSSGERWDRTREIIVIISSHL